MSTAATKGPFRALFGYLVDQRPAKFQVPVSPAVAHARLAEATSNRTLAVWAQPGLTGHVSAQYIYLTKQTALATGGFRTLFFGRLQSTDPDHNESCELAGHFSLPTSAATVFVIGFVGCAFWTLKTLASTVWHDGSVEKLAYSAGALAALVGFFWISRFMGRRDESWLRERIESSLSSPKPEPEPTLDH